MIKLTEKDFLALVMKSKADLNAMEKKDWDGMRAFMHLVEAEVLRLNGGGGEAEPVAWAWGRRDANGEVYDCISDAEHAIHEGKYTVPLYTAPQPQQAAPGAVLEGWQLEKVVAALADGGSVGVKVTRPNGSTHVFWKDGWKSATNPSEKAAFDVLNAMLSAAPKPSHTNEPIIGKKPQGE